MLRIIDKCTTFYIVAPASTATGGPELLHQLAYKLKASGKTVYMFYFPSNRPRPVHENYLQYGIDYVTSVDDHPSNVLIVPEVLTQILDQYHKAKTVIWWLSVDNYFRNLPGLKGRINRLMLNWFDSQSYVFYNSKVQNADHHLVQSKYAQNFLNVKGIENVSYLSDYLHESFLVEVTSSENKRDIVAYNPKKGIRFTSRLIRMAPDITFVAIENMTRQEVVNLLKSAKVYIDFGFHPGKDRIPREAAFLNCCVITNMKGSAGWSEDLPIPNEFKFDDVRKSMPKIIEKIYSCFSDYESNSRKFEMYRSEIRQQETEFNTQMRKIFFLESDGC